MYDKKTVSDLIKRGQKIIKQYEEDTTITKQYQADIIMLWELRVATLYEVLTGGIEVVNSMKYYLGRTSDGGRDNFGF